MNTSRRNFGGGDCKTRRADVFIGWLENCKSCSSSALLLLPRLEWSLPMLSLEPVWKERHGRYPGVQMATKQGGTKVIGALKHHWKCDRFPWRKLYWRNFSHTQHCAWLEGIFCQVAWRWRWWTRSVEFGGWSHYWEHKERLGLLDIPVFCHSFIILLLYVNMEQHLKNIHLKWCLIMTLL